MNRLTAPSKPATRAKPYARPDRDFAVKNQLSIRGSSGPTWIVVSNVIRGTTEADLREILLQFGNIEAVTLSKSALPAGSRSLTFEVAFTHATSAEGAIDKLDGILADGQVLTVRKRGFSGITPSTERPGSIKDVGGERQNEVSGVKSRTFESKDSNALRKRLLSPAELQNLSRRQRSVERTTSGPNKPSANSLALAERIGSIPLVMRLGGTPSSTAVGQPRTMSQKKRKDTNQASKKAKGAKRMDVD